MYTSSRLRDRRLLHICAGPCRAVWKGDAVPICSGWYLRVAVILATAAGLVGLGAGLLAVGLSPLSFLVPPLNGMVFVGGRLVPLGLLPLIGLCAASIAVAISLGMSYWLLARRAFDAALILLVLAGASSMCLAGTVVWAFRSWVMATLHATMMAIVEATNALSGPAQAILLAAMVLLLACAGGLSALTGRQLLRLRAYQSCAKRVIDVSDSDTPEQQVQ